MFLPIPFHYQLMELITMAQDSEFIANLSSFLYPESNYYGQFKPEYLVFNANLQEFSQRVNCICHLQTLRCTHKSM
jgi:hypothetical protein